MPTPPTYQKVNPADQPILYLALTSPTLPMSPLDEYGETMMAQQISMVDGVAQVQVFGVAEVRRPHPGRPAGTGVARHRHRRGRAAIENQNVNLPTGILYGPQPPTRSRPAASS